MHERVRRELELVRTRYPDLEVGPGLDWATIPNFPLPPGRFERARTRLHFLIPPGYPQTGPDNFFVDADLRLKGSTSGPPGLNPGASSSTGAAKVPGNWAWFSWHPAAWRPAAEIPAGDNLLTFLRGVTACLEGRDAT